jgi:hypothetical protein
VVGASGRSSSPGWLDHLAGSAGGGRRRPSGGGRRGRSGLERKEKGKERRWRRAHLAAGPALPLAAGTRPAARPWRIGEKREWERGEVAAENGKEKRRGMRDCHR